jgi:PAS domain S-box-containing protein
MIPEASSLHRRIQEMLLGFSRGISSTLSVATALDSLSSEANTLFGTRRVSVWIHDRRARELVLTASSDRSYGASGVRIPTSSESWPGRGLRLEGPQILALQGAPSRALVGPLRGWRRALGTLVIEGEPRDLREEDYLEAVADLGRQLSFALENVQLLDEVLRHRRLLEDTFNSLADLVVVTDTALRVVQTNDALLSRVDRGPHDVIDRPLAEIVGPEIASWVAEAPSAASDRSASDGRSRQFTDERLGGIFSATVTPLINREGQPVGHVLVARDISAHVQLEAEREGLRGRLAQSEKLASLGQFVAGIAHEMNNPLQGVLGHLELLIETSDAAKPIRSTLRQIYQEGDRAAKIVRNLLVFTGSQRMARRRVRVDRLVSRALASRSASLRRNRIEVRRHIAPDVPPVSGDPLLLQQALLNILINAEHAIAARNPSGRIDISAEITDSQTVRLAIQDSGPGIPPEALTRIFDPFFTTKEVGQGTGLGLAITYGIVQEHGGAIHAENAPDGGARFVIELPTVRDQG